MSHIPSAAMPRAAPSEVLEREEPQQVQAQDHSEDRVDLPRNGLFGMVRDNATLALIAGGVLAGGAIAYPYLRDRLSGNADTGKRKKKSKKKS